MAAIQSCGSNLGELLRGTRAIQGGVQPSEDVL
jgi:hypothetical protein